MLVFGGVNFLTTRKLPYPPIETPNPSVLETLLGSNPRGGNLIPRGIGDEFSYDAPMLVMTPYYV